MKIHFGLHFSPNAYIDLQKRGGIMYDECIANVDELVRLLNLHLGIHTEEIAQADRQAAYHAAFTKVDDKKTLAKSWEQNSLGVSNECLKWRDALVACGWNADMKQPSARLQVLADAEKHFHAPCAADNLVALLPVLKQQNPLPAGSVIYVAATSFDSLPPVVAELLSLLEEKGTKIVFEEDKAIASPESNLAKVQKLILNAEKNELNKDDDSLEIWNFPTAIDAYRYISSVKEQANLYICNDTKTLDNVQRMMGQATSGSKMSNAHPQIAQLFKLGITLFEHPFNIRNLVSWLMMPNHPLPYELRHALANVVVSKGGIHNDDYETAIATYKDKVAEEEGKRKDKKIDDMINTFIPVPDENGVDKDTLCNFLVQLGGWCNKMTKLEDFTEIKKAQFAKVGGLCNALLSIVKSASNDVIAYRQVESWASSLYQATDFALYDAQAGSRWTTTACDIVDEAENVVWTDCYNYASATLATEFLNVHELTALTESGCRFWDSSLFNLAMMHDAMRPVLLAKRKLVLVTADQNKSEATAKHPLIIRLEETYGDTLKAIVKHPVNEATETAEVTAVTNDHKGDKVEFGKADLVTMPDHESYSALENLIQYPVDYFMEKILRFHDRASYQLDAIETVKGHVAHRVIEKLFTGTAAAIGLRLKDLYDKFFDQAVEEQGAILLLKENIIELKMFREQLKENLDVLLDIISQNRLEVVGTEHEVKLNVGLLADAENDPPVRGFVDMLLKTPSGSMVVFDFKWTSSKSKHKRLLEENASIQLALYDRLVSLDTGNPVAATAYYTMPFHKLYTTSNNLVEMRNVEHVQPTNNEDLLQQLINSYRYRRTEILSGTVATEEGYAIGEELAYVAETAKQNLVSLKEYEGVHSYNTYSNYNCFKGTLK